MCATAGALSVASMRTYLVPLAAALGCAAAPATAHAAAAVYGGATSGHDAIAVTADTAMKRLSSAVVSWSARCDDGRDYPYSAALDAAVAQPGFSPGADDLVMARNAGGRFKGVVLGSFGAGDDATAAVVLTLDGKLSAKRASGTLSGTVKIIDDATGDAVTSCQTGSERWAATRAPGTVFAGKTSQDEPVVVRADVKRHKVSDFMLTWESQSCTPQPQFMRFPEHFGNFRLARSGAFGAPFSEDDPMDGGGQATFSYKVGGHVRRTSASGTYRAGVVTADATGARTESCDSGGVTWKALSS